MTIQHIAKFTVRNQLTSHLAYGDNFLEFTNTSKFGSELISDSYFRWGRHTRGLLLFSISSPRVQPKLVNRFSCSVVETMRSDARKCPLSKCFPNCSPKPPKDKTTWKRLKICETCRVSLNRKVAHLSESVTGTLETIYSGPGEDIIMTLFPFCKITRYLRNGKKWKINRGKATMEHY